MIDKEFHQLLGIELADLKILSHGGVGYLANDSDLSQVICSTEFLLSFSFKLDIFLSWADWLGVRAIYKSSRALSLHLK